MADPRSRPELAERRVQLRLPAELYEAVFGLAKEELRTLNGTVTLLLREALAARGLDVPTPTRRRRG